MIVLSYLVFLSCAPNGT